MKIGIITVPNASNCGSFLQAYALKEFLERAGHEAIFVKTRSDEYIKNLFYNNSLLIRSIIKWPIIGIKRWLFWKKEYSLFCDTCAQCLNIVDDNNLDPYDAIILGSDEIWNVKNEVYNRAIFYGLGREDTIAYAVSVGNATIGDYENRREIITDIDKVPYIYPRDENTKKIVEHYTDRRVQCVCDPTLLIDWNENTSKLPDELVDKQYIMLYAYSISEDMKKNILMYAKKNNLKVVSVGFFYMWADINLAINPLQLYTICKHAFSIVTETFHGTIFSALSGTRFVSFPTGSKSKVLDFMNRFGCIDRAIESTAGWKDFNNKISQDFNYSKFSNIVRNYRESSSSLLLKSLQEIERNAKK